MEKNRMQLHGESERIWTPSVRQSAEELEDGAEP